MFTILKTKTVFHHPRITILEDEILLPQGEKSTYLKFKTVGRAAEIICIREDGKILIQKEYSHPLEEQIYQFPGGFVSEEEDLKIGANRELMEEAGYEATKLELIGRYISNHRRSSFTHYVFLGTSLIEKKLQQDIEESFESFWFTPEEIDALILNGSMINGHLLSVWSIYNAYSKSVLKHH